VIIALREVYLVTWEPGDGVATWHEGGQKTSGGKAGWYMHLRGRSRRIGGLGDPGLYRETLSKKKFGHSCL
jgi:hypothetical protein